jgi:Na+-transporting methylmalonyl-CoA/oxaloacetate decarboxylase gamma subunit
MTQLFYAIAVIVLLFFAVRLMSKIQDSPKKESEPEDLEKLAKIEEEKENELFHSENK